MTNHCGNCTACCRVFEIPELEKPAGKWCQHCAIGSHCKVYEQRPQMCAEFSCLWLLSQSREDPGEHLPLELRPDHCRVVFSPSTNDMIMAATVMPGSTGAWSRKEVRNLIDRLVRNGMGVVVGEPRSTKRLMFDHRGMHEVRMTEPDKDGMQWNIPEERSIK